LILPFDKTGRTLKGWIMVEDKALKDGKKLNGWINKAIDLVSTLLKK